MGKDARRMARLSVVIALVGAVSPMASGIAFADAVGGVYVPNSTFRQGTGIQEIDISVARPMVGSVETLVIWPLYNSNGHWLLGVIADRPTGARCAYDAGQWQCVPGPSGWQAGRLQVQVSTTDAMDCGPAPGACPTDELEIQSIPFGPNPSGGSPNGRLISLDASVLITTDGQPDQTSASATPFASVSATASVPASTPASVPASASASASPAALAPSAGPRPTSIDAENTSLTAPQGPGLGLFAALLIPVLVGTAAPFGLQAAKRRRARRRAGTARVGTD